MLNDTFDDLTFSNINTQVDGNDPKEPPKKPTDIAFDDSFFINSQDLSILSKLEETLEVKKTEITTKIQFSEPNLKENDSSFTNRSHTSDYEDLFEQSKHGDSDLFNESASSLKEEPPLDTQKLNLASWNLPESILQKYASRKIISMFPWQVECLSKPKVLKQHANLVYSAPTSAGKTLVAEILSIKTILERGKKVIFVLPFVSVVREKMFYFREIFGGSGVRVEGFMGSYNPPGGFKGVQLAVCTIEKANSLINNFLIESTLSKIGAIIIDEIHLLGDPNRGYILELLLTKLKYISLKDPSIDLQIIGMSATLPNLSSLSTWLNAELYITDFRPIPLQEHALCGKIIYDNNFTPIRTLSPLPDLETDTDFILQLCLETIKDNCSVLIFCPTKNWCENLAVQIATAFFKLGTGKTEISVSLRVQLKADLIGEVLEQLKGSPSGLDPILRKSVSFGVAFHHAGLTHDERDIVEGAFRNGAVRVLVATSTLSSGVNLPAKRVIIRSPLFHGKPIEPMTYKQMTGRAGRMGKDTSGESIIVCQDERIAKSLFNEVLPPIESCLDPSSGRFLRALLEIIASGVATTIDDVDLFTRCTFASSIENEESLNFLLTNELLQIREDRCYVATALGKACLSSSIPPEEGLSLFAELDKARRCFVLDCELHLIYLVTPYSACNQWGTLDWMLFLDQWERLSESEKRVGEMVGVKESYLVSATRGKIQTNTSKLYKKFLIHKRFFVALALQDLVNERSLSEVCLKFNCNRGQLQNLQMTAATFAGMVTAFSRQLGWSTVEILIAQFQDRLHFGVGRDLLDLMRLPILNGKTARALCSGGLETLVQLANSDIATIEGVLHKLKPFETGKQREGESEHALKERNKLRNIWITGKEGLTEREAAELLLISAREYLTLEMGLKEAKWENTKLEESLIDLESSPGLNSSTDFIVTSQDESYISWKTPKRKRFTRQSLNDTPKKKIRNCETITKLEIVDVCTSHLLMESFKREVEQIEKFSLSVACSNVTTENKVIGLTPSTPSDLKYSHSGRKVSCFALTWDQQTCYYLDLSKESQVVDLLKSLLSHSEKTVVLFNCKDTIKTLKQCCQIDVKSKIEDPKVCDWLIEPEGKEKTFQAMVAYHCSALSDLAKLCGLQKGCPSLNFPEDPKVCSCVESFCNWQLMKQIKETLLEMNPVFEKTLQTEMACLSILAKMELQGMCVDRRQLSKLVNVFEEKQRVIEKKAYSIAGRRFSFTSTKEVAKVLGLPGRKPSTNKQILEKCSHPLSPLIRQWRKLHATYTKSVQPLIYSIQNSRIHPNSFTFTSTGRITMHEPNIQNVAKNFDVEEMKVSCRDAFIAGDGNVMVSADYCQLELRLLAHLSQDEVLCRIMRSGGDVFRAVAAKWNRIEEEEVDDSLRQHAKQICYGIIYGMGSKALGEQLNVEEEEASVFMETFRNAYPGIKKYIKNVIDICQQNGFVETLSGRRRYLPNINQSNSLLQSQAERQAVNTTIQGSAADLVKNVMIVLDCCHYPGYKPILVLHLHDELIYEVPKEKMCDFVAILKNKMEASVQLSVPFPVKVKVGGSWGQLTEFKL